MSATPRRSGAIAGVIVLVLLGGGLLVWKLRGTDGGPTSVEAPPPSATTAARTPSSTTNAKVAPRAPEPVADQPQPVPLDPSATPPSLDAPHSKPAPPQVPFTREETIAKREADLRLLDDTRARLENDLAIAKAASDATGAAELQVRITRLGTLRKLRSTELDQIRAGGALPK